MAQPASGISKAGSLQSSCSGYVALVSGSNFRIETEAFNAGLKRFELASYRLIVQAVAAHRQTEPTDVLKEFTARRPAFGLCLQQHEIGHFANARCSLMNSREIFFAHELHERFGVLFLRQPDLINNHVVIPYP
jgi:hypothetical protein